MSCGPAKAAFSFCKRYEQMSEFAGPFVVIDVTRMQKFRGLCCQFLVFNELAPTHLSIVNFLYGCVQWNQLTTIKFSSACPSALTAIPALKSRYFRPSKS